MRGNQRFFVTICQEGIVLSQDDQIWFFHWDDLDRLQNVEGFLEALGC